MEPGRSPSQQQDNSLSQARPSGVVSQAWRPPAIDPGMLHAKPAPHTPQSGAGFAVSCRRTGAGTPSLPLLHLRRGQDLHRWRRDLASTIVRGSPTKTSFSACTERGCKEAMQLNRTTRIAGITVSGAALGLLPAAGVAAAHDAGSSGAGLHGRVVSVGMGDFVLDTFHGGTTTVDTIGSTAYSELGSSTPLPGVVDGEWVSVGLDPSAQSPTAMSVTVFPQSVGGKVTNPGSSVMLPRGRMPRPSCSPRTPATSKGMPRRQA